ncbi:MAG: hypothetical protein V3S51_02335 [Dehalococcoidia bacterium]
MSRIMIRGTIIVFSLGIIAFLVLLLLDFLTRLWRPAIKPLVGEDYLVTIIAVVITLPLIAAVGFIFSRENLSGRVGRFLGRIPIINWFVGDRRIPQSVHDMPGALVRFSEGSYYIAALVGKQDFRNKKGEMELMYKLYCPSAPVPWSGLPIIFARQEHVILLKLSFAEVYGITTSFGRTAPQILEELELGSTAT